MLAGAMMNADLTINSIMSYAKKVYGNVEIVSVTHDHDRFRYTYKDAFKRVDKLANALSKMGLKSSDRVATIAWNDHRHFELYYGISCSGFVCHTINPRLYSEQLEYILHHAEDKVIFVDAKKKIRMQRYVKKGGNKNSFNMLDSRQLLPSAKKKLCDRTINNNFSLAILKKTVKNFTNNYE